MGPLAVLYSYANKYNVKIYCYLFIWMYVIYSWFYNYLAWYVKSVYFWCNILYEILKHKYSDILLCLIILCLCKHNIIHLRCMAYRSLFYVMRENAQDIIVFMHICGHLNIFYCRNNLLNIVCNTCLFYWWYIVVIINHNHLSNSTPMFDTFYLCFVPDICTATFYRFIVN